MRRNKILSGWNAIPNKKAKFVKSKISWTTNYEVQHYKEDNLLSKIVQIIIRISLIFAFDRKNITNAKLKITANNTYAILSSAKFKFIPSSVAFYLFFSIIPISVIVVSTIAFIDMNWNNFLMDEILSFIIPGFNTLFTINSDWNAANILLTLIFLSSSIWFASKGISKFRDSFTELYGFDNKQNFLVKRMKSIIVVILISIFLIISSIAFIPVVQWIKLLITNTIAYQYVLYALLFIYFLFFGYIGIGLLFKYISPIRLKWSYLNLGILTTLIPLILFILLFSSICKFLNYERFGVIGSFLYLMLFVQYISYFLHAGIIINSSYYKLNVYQNVEIKKSFISTKLAISIKNLWNKAKYYFRK